MNEQMLQINFNTEDISKGRGNVKNIWLYIW